MSSTKATTPTSTREQLTRLASRQGAWSTLPAADKLALLRQVQNRLSAYGGYQTACNVAVQETMGLPLHTVEGSWQRNMEVLSFVSSFKITLEYLINAYAVFAGEQAPPATPIVDKGNGQYAVQVFPLNKDEKTGPLAATVGEAYMDPAHVKSVDDIKTFDWSLVQEAGQQGGAAVVLGAGNFGILTFCDCFAVMFRYNRVVMIKHHPLREYQDDPIRYIMAPLIDAGYLDTSMDADFDRQAVYDKSLVSLVHMTGGKATHDAIVWGPTEAERAKRRKQNKPLLQAQMSSELGCVTPWIMTPGVYTDAELKGQVRQIAKATIVNASCACNAPKVLMVAHDWKQKDEFLDLLMEFFKTTPSPVAYYPGIQERWQTFKDNVTTGSVREVACQLNVQERQLHTPKMQKEPVLLPFLMHSMDVDLSTPQGVKAAAAECAFQNEPFCPVFTICTIQSTTSPQEFMQTAVKICNQHIFGTLSVMMSAPAPLLNDPMVNEACANLRYGTVSVNAWSAFAYNCKGLPWGAHPGEDLKAIQSGIGSVNQYCFMPHVVKGVIKFDSKGVPDIMFPDETRATAHTLGALSNLLLHPGIFAVLKVLWCLFMIEIEKLLKSLKLA